MKGSSFNDLQLLFPMIVNPRLNNKSQNRRMILDSASLRIVNHLQQLVPMIVDLRKFQNRQSILKSASSRWSRANMNVRRVSIDTVQDLPEKASMNARPASIINSNGKNCPKVQSFSALSAGQMELCIHVRIRQNLTKAAIAVAQAAIRRGTRVHHSQRMNLGCFSGVKNGYMAATPRLTMVKLMRMSYSIEPLLSMVADNVISTSFTAQFVILLLPDTKHAAGAMSFGICVLLVGA